MIPQFLVTEPVESEALSPPPGVHPVTVARSPRVRTAHWLNAATGCTRAQRAGLRYEEQVQRELAGLVGPDYQRSPAVSFIDETPLGAVRRTCVPDGLLIREALAVVFEIKHRHCVQAWWQLRRIYAPVVAELPFVQRVALVEVCKSFDPGVRLPEEVIRIFDLEAFLRRPWVDFGVFVWKP